MSIPIYAHITEDTTLTQPCEVLTQDAEARTNISTELREFSAVELRLVDTDGREVGLFHQIDQDRSWALTHLRELIRANSPVDCEPHYTVLRVILNGEDIQWP